MPPRRNGEGIPDNDPPGDGMSRKRITHELPMEVFDKLLAISKRDIRTVRQTINFILIQWLIEHEGFTWTGVDPISNVEEDDLDI